MDGNGNDWQDNLYGFNNQQNQNEYNQNMNGYRQQANQGYKQEVNAGYTGYTQGNYDEYTNNQNNQMGYNPNNQMGYNPNNMYNMNMQPPINTPKKKNKQKSHKKKHKFLRFLLKTVLTVLIIVGVIKGSNFLAQREMAKIVRDYPFEFNNESDSLNYVTDNFKVITEYEIEGKTYKVKWKSNDKSIKISEDGDVTVKRPTNASRVVTITQTYKKLLGKAERSYDINVICSDAINKEDIEVITVESIKSGDYNRDIDAVIGENGSLDMLLGDFKNITINSVDDAIVLIEAYKSEFNTPSEVTFKIDKINSTESFNTYIFKAYYKDIELSNKGAIVVTNISSNKLIKIAIDDIEIPNLSGDITNELSDKSVEYANLIEQELISMGYRVDDTQAFIEPSGTLLDNNGVITKYNLVVNDISNTYEVWIQNNKIIKFESLVDNFTKKAVCTGVNEKGEQLSFDASYTEGFFGDKKTYVLYDINRNIYCVKNHGDYTLMSTGTKWMKSDKGLVSFGGTLVSLVGLVEMGISSNINTNITSTDSKFDSADAIAVQSYDNIIDAYDFYKKEFGLISYDNKGSMIKILTDHSLTSDNASWNNLYKVFAINPSTNVKYSTGLHKEVLGHEYTHAVFGDRISGSNKEVSGLNEAYADIMGSLITPESNWLMGDNLDASGNKIIFRDLKNLNNPLHYLNIDYPEQYKDDTWYACGQEEHAISLMIGNIGYKMASSEWFTNSDVAHIWYDSLGLGYNSESTYVTCRKHIIATAEQKNFDAGAIDFIAKCFDEAAIYDSSYIFKTTQNEENVEEAADGTITYKTTSNAIVGDALFDDTTSRKYLIAYSPTDLVLGNGTIVIYEERQGELYWSKDTETATRLAELINSKYPDLNIMDNKINVEYYSVNKYAMGIAEKFCRNSKNTIKNLSLEYMDRANIELTSEDMDWFSFVFDKLFGFMFQWRMITATPYELCNNFGLLD